MANLNFIDRILKMTAPTSMRDESFKYVWGNALRFFLKYMIISFLLIVVCLVIFNLLGIEIHNVLSSKEYKDINNPFFVSRIWTMILLGPFIEEMMFRMWHSFKPIQISLSLFFFFYFILTQLILQHSHNVSIMGIQSDYFEFPIVKSIISSILACSVFFFRKQIKAIPDKYMHTLIIASVMIFALLHLTNVRCDWYVYPFVVVMCFPQLTLGLTVTYLRNRRGFIAGLLFHCFVNFSSVLMSHINDIGSLFGKIF